VPLGALLVLMIGTAPAAAPAQEGSAAAMVVAAQRPPHVSTMASGTVRTAPTTDRATSLPFAMHDGALLALGSLVLGGLARRAPFVLDRRPRSRSVPDRTPDRTPDRSEVETHSGVPTPDPVTKPVLSTS